MSWWIFMTRFCGPAMRMRRDFYPYAREALQLMTNRDDICMILWSGCYDEQMAMYRSRFAEEGIRFDYANENPRNAETSTW